MSDDLINRLQILAGMIAMGERISWGEDSSIMNEAADAIEAAKRENELLRKMVAARCHMCCGTGISGGAGSCSTGSAPQVTLWTCDHGIDAALSGERQ